MSLTPGEGAGEKRAARTAPELAVLLLELARIVKARRFYGAGDARLADVFGRSLRAWRSDLMRSGPLTLEIRSDGFAELGGGGVLHHARLEDLLRDLRARGVETLTFDADMDGDALAAFADLVASDESLPKPGAGGFAERLRRLVPVGVAVTEQAQTAPGPPLAPPAAVVQKLEAVALSPADAASGAAAEPELEGAPAVSPDADTLPMDPAEQLSQLDLLLAELEVCDSAGSYLDLARRAVREAERVRGGDALYRVVDRLAGDIESKHDRLHEIAGSLLESLCGGDALAPLLERVAHAEGAEQVRAAQILALVGEPIAARVLDRLPSFPERIRRERMFPLILALGERAVPELLQRLARPDREDSRFAALLLGMLQHPAAVTRLAELLAEPDANLREDAAKALVRIGSEDAVAALARGLRGDGASAIATAHHLAATSSPRAVGPLSHALERALDAKDANLAKELLRALGRLGRPEANTAFGALMRRKSGLGSRWMRDVKIAAATALATVPGDQAVALLAEALESRDDGLRRAAQRALDRRAESVSRAAPGALR